MPGRLFLELEVVPALLGRAWANSTGCLEPPRKLLWRRGFPLAGDGREAPKLTGGLEAQPTLSLVRRGEHLIQWHHVEDAPLLITRVEAALGHSS